MGAERHVKLFKNARNQAVRIPREFELPGKDAVMRKEGDRLIIEPVPPQSVLAVLARSEPLGAYGNACGRSPGRLGASEPVSTAFSIPARCHLAFFSVIPGAAQRATVRRRPGIHAGETANWIPAHAPRKSGAGRNDEKGFGRT